MTLFKELRERADYEERGSAGTTFAVSGRCTADIMRRAADRIEELESQIPTPAPE